MSGFSPPNFLAFDSGARFSGGGRPVGPETFVFGRAARVSHVQVDVASKAGITGTVMSGAYDKGGHLLDSAAATLSSVMTTVSVDARLIFFVEVWSTASAWALDDLQTS